MSTRIPIEKLAKTAVVQIRADIHAENIDVSGKSLDGKDYDKRLEISGIQTADNLSGTRWNHIKFTDCFFHLTSSTVVFTDCEFENCNFNLTYAKFANSSLSNCNVYVRLDLEMLNSNMTSGGFSFNTKSSRLDECTFSNVEFTGTANQHSLRRVVVEHSRFIGVTTVDSSFTEVRFTDSEFDSTTRFTRTKFESVTVDSIFLESLGDDRGGITDNELRRLDVVDAIADLRLSVGGMWFAIHTLALVAFFGPYAVFLVTMWLKHILYYPSIGGNQTETMLLSLVRYWFNGGASISGWQFAWFTATTSGLFLVLQLVRITLMLKVKDLEHQREIKSIWPQFDANAPARFWERIPWVGQHITWLTLQKVMKVGTYAAIFFGTLHVIKFLMLPVPVGGLLN